MSNFIAFSSRWFSSYEMYHLCLYAFIVFFTLMQFLIPISNSRWTEVIRTLVMTHHCA